MKPRIAVLDDEQRMVDIIGMVLRREGYDVETFQQPDAALSALEKRPFDLLLTDLKMPGRDGVDVLTRARELDPELPVILITAHATLQTAVEAMRRGAFDYVEKPFDNTELKTLVKRALDVNRLSRENRYLRAELAQRYALDAVVSESPTMREVLDLARRSARSRSTVLVSGESGVGKELVARAVHFHSDRVGNPFVAANCKAFAEGVLESEIFGHEKGAFTGADRARPGLFERAHGGTLFLDEIGEIGPDFQTKLLRVLQERTLQRVGGSEEHAVDVRVVAATNRDLRAEVAEGRFREDLYFRLAVIPIQIPPLRERREDVLPLARHFLARWNAELGRSLSGWSPRVEAFLLSHSWPGNVRELENAIERGVVLARGEQIALDDLLVDPEAPSADPPEARGLQDFLDAAAADRIRAVLAETGGVRIEAARRLGVDRTTLYRLMRKFGITGGAERMPFRR
ncbi:MAG: sigma-54 dependent transcriptional regulator [Myxococcota bacterium]|nr:sigma-54 dependent transcriptional regulator [Myxococcota bacterium]